MKKMSHAKINHMKARVAIAEKDFQRHDDR